MFWLLMGETLMKSMAIVLSLVLGSVIAHQAHAYPDCPYDKPVSSVCECRYGGGYQICVPRQICTQTLQYCIGSPAIFPDRRKKKG
jgi:hypothetical protein